MHRAIASLLAAALARIMAPPEGSALRHGVSAQ